MSLSFYATINSAMQDFDISELKELYMPPADSHKGQNGKLLLVGGSDLLRPTFLSQR